MVEITLQISCTYVGVTPQTLVETLFIGKNAGIDHDGPLSPKGLVQGILLQYPENDGEYGYQEKFLNFLTLSVVQLVKQHDYKCAKEGVNNWD